MVRQKISTFANIDYYTHYNVIILVYLGLVYVIIPQSRSNIRSITHGMLFVYVDCLPSITSSEKKMEKNWPRVGFEPVHAFDTGWQTLSLTIAPSGQ